MSECSTKPRAQAEQKPDDETFVCDVSRSEFKPMTDEQWDELKEYCKSGFSGGIDNAIMDLEIELKGGYETDTEQEQEQEPSEPLLATGQEQEQEQEQGGGEGEHPENFNVLVKDMCSGEKRALRVPLNRKCSLMEVKVYVEDNWELPTDDQLLYDSPAADARQGRAALQGQRGALPLQGRGR